MLTTRTNQSRKQLMQILRPNFDLFYSLVRQINVAFTIIVLLLLLLQLGFRLFLYKILMTNYPSILKKLKLRFWISLICHSSRIHFPTSYIILKDLEKSLKQKKSNSIAKTINKPKKASKFLISLVYFARSQLISFMLNTIRKTSLQINFSNQIKTIVFQKTSKHFNPICNHKFSVF